MLTTTKRPMNGKLIRPTWPRRIRREERRQPTLEFTPTAWLKLQCLCHAGDTEIGGFGIVPDPPELLVTDFVTVKQRCTAVTVKFDDDAVADHFEDMVDRGLKPDQFARCWLHTHPGDAPTPSGVDEETFERVFGGCDWAIMFILAHGGATYARLRFNAGPGGEMLLPVGVRWGLPIDEVDQAAWLAEYQANVTEEIWQPAPSDGKQCGRFGDRDELLADMPASNSADRLPRVDFGFMEMEVDDDLPLD